MKLASPMTKEHDDTLAGKTSVTGSESLAMPSIAKDDNTIRSSLNFRESLIHAIGNRLFFLLIIFLFGMGFWAVYVYTRSFGAEVVTKTIENAPVASLLPVLFAGVLGGIISLQKRLKKLPIGDLLLLRHSISHFMLAPLVGGFLATMLYILFVAGLLEGDLFPSFSPDPDISTAIYGMASLLMVHGDSYQDYAKLFFWCFLAGYSERFMTNIFGQFEGVGAQTERAENHQTKSE
jgi:hypothetical protein